MKMNCIANPHILVLFVVISSFQSLAQEPRNLSEEVFEDDLDSIELALEALSNSFSYQNGKIEIGEGLARLELGEKFKFLDQNDARKVLEDLWGNPPDESVLGMIFPKDITPLSDDFTYAIEISFSDEGFVDDEDAEDIDYPELLEQMQDEAVEANAYRLEEGYPTVELVGWASPPFYDKENKKLHWAKELKFDGAEINTLNYNIRVLGRKGYLNLNIIGDMNVVDQVKSDIDEILGSVHFNEGHKYSDFNPKYDKIAAYGIGGLIAGKVLAKVGIFAKVGAFLLKFLKPIIVGLVAAFAAFRKKIFGS
jgi:uncharacterized membrane-anchored protein